MVEAKILNKHKLAQVWRDRKAAMAVVKFENGEIFSHLYAVKSINIKYVYTVAEVLVMLILHINVVAKRDG